MLLANQASASTISSSDLINRAKEYDNKEVRYEGEVIGDIMMRGQHAWINLNDGINAIGIWADKAILKDVIYTGNFRFKGDIIGVAGIFHRSCLEHGGDLDIHANSVRKINPGGNIAKGLNFDKLKIVIILASVLLLLLLLDRVLFKQKY